MKRIVVLLVIAALATTLLASAEGPDYTWFGAFPLPGVLDWYNDIAWAEDMFGTKSVVYIPQVEAGRRMLMFNSVAEAELVVPDWYSQIDVIGYNPEHWGLTPPEEQADLVAAVERLAALGDEYGLLVAVGPDYQFAIDHAVEMAPLIDILALQLQNAKSVQDAIAFAEPLVAGTRAANPDIEIALGLRIDNGLGFIEALVEALGPDGVFVLFDSNGISDMETLVWWLRGQSPTPTPTSETSPLPTSTSETSPQPTPTNTSEISPLPTDTPMPTNTPTCTAAPTETQEPTPTSTPTATPEPTILPTSTPSGEWYDACPPDPICPTFEPRPTYTPQPTYAPEPIPTCRPTIVCDAPPTSYPTSTPYPTLTPYPPQP